jgi:hypothetical protein
MIISRALLDLDATTSVERFSAPFPMVVSCNVPHHVLLN